MLNKSRFPNWDWGKVKGMRRGTKVLPVFVVLRARADIQWLHLLVYALIFLKARL